MTYVEKYFKRADVQEIISFILYGGECTRFEKKSCETRLEDAENRTYDEISKLLRDGIAQEKAMSEIHDFMSVAQNVYMEIGMHVGVKIANQLLNSQNNSRGT